ncbi:hypothetical protein NPIL_694551 [Nephila pilipes]|uniref:Uncharacterized protein n=1 Tax=Nephila pilipes TaxID=299642 RepID=A0A8X6KCP9_NEPPI|nr:hypothetical protein NPIL_694551 [Nephila pilipes]
MLCRSPVWMAITCKTASNSTSYLRSYPPFYWETMRRMAEQLRMGIGSMKMNEVRRIGAYNLAGGGQGFHLDTKQPTLFTDLEVGTKPLQKSSQHLDISIRNGGYSMMFLGLLRVHCSLQTLTHLSPACRTNLDRAMNTMLPNKTQSYWHVAYTTLIALLWIGLVEKVLLPRHSIHSYVVFCAQ